MSHNDIAVSDTEVTHLIYLLAPVRKIMVRRNRNLPSNDNIQRRIRYTICHCVHDLTLPQDIPLALPRPG